MLNVWAASPTTSLVYSFFWGLAGLWGFFPSTFGFFSCSSVMVDRSSIGYDGPTFLIIMLKQLGMPRPCTGCGVRV